MTSTSTCRLLSPAFPSELLAYVLKHHSAPTTLILCSSRASFVANVLDEVRSEPLAEQMPEGADNRGSPETREEGEHSKPRDEKGPRSITPSSNRDKHLHLLTSPLHQLAVSRHIRILYMPTVTHLRAYLSVCGVPGDERPDSSLFLSSSSEVPAPPRPADADCQTNRAEEAHSHTCGALVIYGFLDLHRDTSEWSGQGLSQSISTLVETAQQLKLRDLVLIEPALNQRPQSHNGEDEDWEDGHDIRQSPTHTNTDEQTHARLSIEDVLAEHIPLLTGSGTSTLCKLGIDGDEPGWAGRTLEVGRVLKRWMCFQQGEWS